MDGPVYGYGIELRKEITEEEITAIFGLEDIDIKRRVKSAKIEQQEKKKQETISEIEKREKLEEIPNKEMAVEIYSKKR